MNQNEKQNASKVLQKDTTLPASRGCALRYRMRDVYLYSGIVAVFIIVYMQGFEGPDMRYMTVTRKLK
jgi:predicted secreted protein